LQKSLVNVDLFPNGDNSQPEQGLVSLNLQLK
jgi:hypothetical protein